MEPEYKPITGEGELPIPFRRVDPDYLDPNTEINVKIADLGNACWTVFVLENFKLNFRGLSLFLMFLLISFFL